MTPVLSVQALKSAKNFELAKSLFRKHVDLIPYNKEVDTVIIDILKHHPHWSEKSKQMHSVIKCKNEVDSKDWELRILYTGMKIAAEDISWVKAIRAIRGVKIMERSKHLLVREAARNVIEYQVLLAKIELNAKGDDDLDHVGVLDFEGLLKCWLEKENLDDESLQIRKDLNYKSGKFYTFADSNFSEKWKQFHYRNARVRLLNHKEHMKLSGLKRARKIGSTNNEGVALSELLKKYKFY